MVWSNALALIGLMGAGGPAPADDAVGVYVNGLNDTGFQLARSVLRTKPEGGNLVLSPYSAAHAFLMLAYGCRGEDRTDLLKGFGLAALDDDAKILEAAGLQATMGDVPGKPFTTSNAFLTIGDDAQPVPAFQNTIHTAFAGEFFALRGDEAVDKINQWVSDRSRGRIPRVLKELPKEIEYALINVATYDGQWVKPFDTTTETSPGTTNFTTASGEKIRVDMMSRPVTPTGWVSTPTCDAVALPYKDGAYAMVVAVPTKGKDPAALLESWTAGGWAKLTAAFVAEPVLVAMPAFSARSEFDLIKPLRAQGVSRVFDRFNARHMATSSKPPGDKIMVSIQQACIDVDRLGTKAAAVTFIGGGFGGGAPNPPKRLLANKPFVYALYHVKTGAIAFLGVCSTPPAPKPAKEPARIER